MVAKMTLDKLRPTLIVGLGNPGKTYVNNRHNIGFQIVDSLAQRHHATWQHKPAWCAEVAKIAPLVFAVKPTTYMNESGRAVRAIADYYEVAHHNICLVYDDCDLTFSKLRWTPGFRTGAHHNGVRSVARTIGRDFVRLRFGVANNAMRHIPLDQFVLQDFNVFEKSVLSEGIDRAVSELIGHFKID